MDLDRLAQQIIRDARKLKDEKYQARDAKIQLDNDYRFRKVDPVPPKAYRKTAKVYKAPVIEDEGNQVATLVYAMPVAKCPAPRPEDQPATSATENWCHALMQQAEALYGAVWWKNTTCQIHNGLSVIYWGWKRNAYAGAPTAPKDDAPLEEKMAFDAEFDAFKRKQGVDAFLDYRHVPLETWRCIGNVQNPSRTYEVKDVDEMELIAEYDLEKGTDGKLRKLETTTLPSGSAQDSGISSSKKLKVIEYWDRKQCMIVIENGDDHWEGMRRVPNAMVLDHWEHNWGRVPYFVAPAFENEVLEEEHRYRGPLEALKAEVPGYNELRTMQSNVAYLKGYPTWQDVPSANGEAGVDDASKPRIHETFEPGVIYDMLPGHEMKTVPMDTGPELLQEVLASEARIKQFSLSDVSKGISPGADTANSALTQLRRLQRSSLSQMSENQARQAREMFRFALQRVVDANEVFPVYSEQERETIALAPEQIVSMNLQVKVAPDTGQDMLIEEKQAFELWTGGLITQLEAHERRGKANPEEYVLANEIEDFWVTEKPTLYLNIRAALGDSQAIAQLVAMSQQTGDARDAVPEIMRSIRAARNGGMGSGSGGQPRAQGVRSPAVAQTTQPQNGVGPYA